MTKKPARKTKRKVSARNTRALALAKEASMPVTRGMLADLRDEIESVIQRYAAQTVEAHNRADGVYALHQKSKSVIDEIRRRVDEARTLLALDTDDPHINTLGDRVTWSYFHVWIARINARLDALEGAKSAAPRKMKDA